MNELKIKNQQIEKFITYKIDLFNEYFCGRDSGTNVGIANSNLSELLKQPVFELSHVHLPLASFKKGNKSHSENEAKNKSCVRFRCQIRHMPFFISISYVESALTSIR